MTSSSLTASAGVVAAVTVEPGSAGELPDPVCVGVVERLAGCGDGYGEKPDDVDSTLDIFDQVSNKRKKAH